MYPRSHNSGDWQAPLANFFRRGRFSGMNEQQHAAKLERQRRHRERYARLDLYLPPDLDARLRAAAVGAGLRPGAFAVRLLTDAVSKGRKASKSKP